MRPYARVRAGRIVALALRVWLRRSLQLHAVAILCLAPLVVVPDILGNEPLWEGRVGNPFRDPAFVGFSGLYTTSWAVVVDLIKPRGRFVKNAAVFYLAQFAVSILVVRDAYRHLSGRTPRCGPRAALGLAVLAVGGLALFVALHAVPAAAMDGSPLVLLGIAATVVDLYLAGAYWLALPAAAVHGHGPLAALGRSSTLSRGSRYSIGAVIAWLVVLQTVALLPGAILVDALGLWSAGRWTLFALGILYITVKGCVLAAAYHEACFRKEGAGTEEVTAVFA